MVWDSSTNKLFGIAGEKSFQSAAYTASEESIYDTVIMKFTLNSDKTAFSNEKYYRLNDENSQ
jgi:hypothetical protein